MDQPVAGDDLRLVRSDIQYMRRDLEQLRGDFKDFRTYYATREQLVQLEKDMTLALTNLSNTIASNAKTAEEADTRTNKRITAIYGFGGTILGVITTIIIGAIAKVVFGVG